MIGDPPLPTKGMIAGPYSTKHASYLGFIVSSLVKVFWVSMTASCPDTPVDIMTGEGLAG